MEPSRTATTALDRLKARARKSRGEDSGETKFSTALDRIKERAASQRLSEEQRLLGAQRRSQTHLPLSDPKTRKGIPEVDPTELTEARDVQTAVADKATRMGLAKDMQLISRLGVETAGAFTGGKLATSLASGAVKSKAGRAAARIAGESIGEATGALASQAFDPVDDPFGNARNAALFGTFADGLSTVMGAGVRRARNGTMVTDGTRATLKILGEDAPTAGRLSANRAVDFVENVSGAAIFGGGRIKQKNELAARRGIEIVKGYVERFTQGASKEEVNRLVSDIVDGSLRSFKTSSESLYSKVDDLAPVGVDTASMIDIRNTIVRENQSGGIGTGLDQIVRAIDRTLGVPKGKRGIESNVMVSSKPRLEQRRPGQEGYNPLFPGEFYQVRDASSSVTFAEAAKLRSDMLGAQRSAEDTFANQLKGATDRVAPVVDAAMTAAAATIDNPEAFNMWRTANAFWKDGADAYSEGVMRALANTRPDELFNAIIQGNHEQQIKRFRKLVLGGVGDTEDTAKGIRAKTKRVLADPKSSDIAKDLAKQRLASVEEGEKAWEKFKGQFMLNILTGADEASGLSTKGGKGTRTIVGSSAMTRLSNFGDDALRELFVNKSERRQFERMLRAVEMAQSGTGIGEGRLMIQMSQAGIIFGLIGFDVDAASAAATVIIPPAIAARVLTNPAIVRWATIGARGGGGTRRAFARLAEIAARNGARVQDDRGEDLNVQRETEEARRLREFSAASLRRPATRTQGVQR